MYGVGMPSVNALAQDFLTTAVPSWMTVTRGAGSWSRQTAPALNGTTFIELGTAQNTGRFDYGDTVGRKMLLIEPTRVNLFPDANFVDTTPANNIPDGWVTNAGAAGVDYTTQPGGPHGGTVVRHENTANASGVEDDLAIAGATLYQFSAWVRAAGALAAGKRLYGFNDDAAYAYLTLPDGAAFDWRRLFTSATTIGGSAASNGIFQASASLGAMLSECLPQLEAGDCPTSPIAGTGGAKTRAAELCAIDACVIGRTSGLVQFLWRPDYASTAALTVDPVLLEWAPGWELMYDVSEDKLSVVVNSVTRAASSALTWARGDLLRLSVRYSSAGQQLIVEQAGGVIDIAEDATSWADPGALAPYLGSRAASVNCRPSAFGDFLSAAL